MTSELPPEMWEAILIKFAKSSEKEGYKEASQYLMHCRLVCQTWRLLINGILLSCQNQDWNLMFARKPKDAVKRLTKGWRAIGSTKLQGVGDLAKWTTDFETSFIKQPECNPFPDNCLILNCAGATTTADGIASHENDNKRLSECLSGIEVWGHYLHKFVYIACDEMAETRRNVRAILDYLPNLETFTMYTYTWWKCSKKLRELPQGHNGSSVTDWLRVAGIAAQSLKCHHDNSRSSENDETENTQLEMKALKICDISQQILYTLELGAKRYHWPLQRLSMKFISVEGIRGISWANFVHMLYHFCDTLEHLRLEATSQDFVCLNYQNQDDEFDNQTVSHFTFPKLKLLAVSYAFCCLTSKYPMLALVKKCEHLQKLQFIHSTIIETQVHLDLQIKSWLRQEGLCNEIEISHVCSDTF